MHQPACIVTIAAAVVVETDVIPASAAISIDIRLCSVGERDKVAFTLLCVLLAYIY